MCGRLLENLQVRLSVCRAIRNRLAQEGSSLRVFTYSPVAGGDSIAVARCPHIKLFSAPVALEFVEADDQIHSLQISKSP